MLTAFSKYAGVIQAVLGAIGTAAPTAIPAIGTSQGGSIFNESTVGIIVNLAVGAWGLIAGFMKKKAA